MLIKVLTFRLEPKLGVDLGGSQGPGVLSIRHDSSDSIHAARAMVNTASAPVRDRRVVNSDPDICLVTRERRGPVLGDRGDGGRGVAVASKEARSGFHDPPPRFLRLASAA